MNQSPASPTQNTLSQQQRQQLRARLQKLADALDSAFQIPGTSIRFGADALVGLIPGFGDIFGFAMGLWLIWQARSVNAPGRLQIRMLGNLAFEAVVGVVPVLGDAFDVLWQANQRNRKILVDWMDEQDAQADTKPNRAYWLWALLGVAALAGLSMLML